MKEMYKYSIELFQVAQTCADRNFYSKEVENILDKKYLEEALARVASENKTKDSFYKADLKLSSEVSGLSIYDRHKVYLTRLGITQQPYKVLYDKLTRHAGRIYFEGDLYYEYTDTVVHEKLYAENATTVEEFKQEFEKQYNGMAELRFCSGPYLENCYTIYEYDKLYTEFSSKYKYKEETKR